MDRRDLIKDLELLNPALGNLVPIFECFLFHKNGTVMANSDSLAIVLPCEIKQSFALNGKTLLGLLKASNSDTVEFAPDHQDIKITAGRSTFKLPFIEEKDFIFEEPKPKWDVSLTLYDDVIEGLTICLDTASKDNTQPALMGVHIRDGILYSCDGDALTRYKTEWDKTVTGDYMLPNAFCEAVIRLSAEVNYDGAGLELTQDWAHAWFDNRSIYGRLLENTNPLDHEKLITETIKGKPTYLPVPDGLAAALARARVISDQETCKTVLSVEAKRLKLLTESKHLGVVRDTIAFGDHPTVTANVSAGLVARAIAPCTEMAIFDNCLCLRKEDKLLQVVSNMD